MGEQWAYIQLGTTSSDTGISLQTSPSPPAHLAQCDTLVVAEARGILPGKVCVCEGEWEGSGVVEGSTDGTALLHGPVSLAVPQSAGAVPPRCRRVLARPR